MRPNFGPEPGHPPLLAVRTPAPGPVVVIVTCEVAACVPSSVTDGGTNPHIDPAGKPVQLNVTVCVDPFAGVTVNPTIPAFPAVTETAPGIAAKLKSAAAFTTCVIAGDVLPVLFPSPAYCAVIEWDPTASDDVIKVAMPPPPTVPVPIDVAPSRNVTIPVTVPAVFAVTVAVNVTADPAIDGFADDVTAVVVVAGFTTKVVGPEVLDAYVVSPPYITVITCEPCVIGISRFPAPPACTAVVPIDVPPSSTVNVPVIVPTVFDVTLIRNCTVAPLIEGFGDTVNVVVVAAFVDAFTTCEIAGDIALAA
jgi:hypothetical protein